MFEHEQDIVEALLEASDEFRRLFETHGALKAQVRDAELGTVPVDPARLHALKREKLLLKDRMAAMISEYRREHASVGQG